MCCDITSNEHTNSTNERSTKAKSISRIGSLRSFSNIKKSPSRPQSISLVNTNYGRSSILTPRQSNSVPYFQKDSENIANQVISISPQKNIGLVVDWKPSKVGKLDDLIGITLQDDDVHLRVLLRGSSVKDTSDSVSQKQISTTNRINKVLSFTHGGIGISKTLQFNDCEENDSNAKYKQEVFRVGDFANAFSISEATPISTSWLNYMLYDQHHGKDVNLGQFVTIQKV